MDTPSAVPAAQLGANVEQRQQLVHELQAHWELLQEVLNKEDLPLFSQHCTGLQICWRIVEMYGVLLTLGPKPTPSQYDKFLALKYNISRLEEVFPLRKLKSLLAPSQEENLDLWHAIWSDVEYRAELINKDLSQTTEPPKEEPEKT